MGRKKSTFVKDVLPDDPRIERIHDVLARYNAVLRETGAIMGGCCAFVINVDGQEWYLDQRQFDEYRLDEESCVPEDDLHRGRQH